MVAVTKQLRHLFPSSPSPAPWKGTVTEIYVNKNRTKRKQLVKWWQLQYLKLRFQLKRNKRNIIQWDNNRVRCYLLWWWVALQLGLGRLSMFHARLQLEVKFVLVYVSGPINYFFYTFTAIFCFQTIHTKLRIEFFKSETELIFSKTYHILLLVSLNFLW